MNIELNPLFSPEKECLSFYFRLRNFFFKLFFRRYDPIFYSIKILFLQFLILKTIIKIIDNLQ